MVHRSDFGVVAIAIALAIASGLMACSSTEPAAVVEAARPVDCRIAIDIGHTPKAGGTTSARGVPEFSFNQRMAREVLAELKARGLNAPFIINESGDEISLRARTAEAEQHKADLFLSFHHDSAQLQYFSKWQHEGVSRIYSDRFSGYSLFYAKTAERPEESIAFARQIAIALRNAGFEPTLHHAVKIQGESRELVDAELGIYNFSELAVLRTAKMPAVLFEGGVIVNRQEEALLNDSSYRRKLVNTVASALVNSCADQAARAALAMPQRQL